MTRKNNVLFLGFAISEAEMAKIIQEDQYPSVQTFSFTNKLLKALSVFNDVTCISTKAVSDFPFNKRFLFRGLDYFIHSSDGRNIPVKEFAFVNYGLFKVLTRFAFSFFYTSREVMRALLRKEEIDYLVVYSVHLPYMLTGVLVSRLFRVPLIGVWTDPPAVPSSMDGKLKGALRKIEFFISKKIMACYKKVIVLSKYLALDFSSEAKYLVIEAIVDDEINSELDCLAEKSSDGTKVAYLGSVNEAYGLRELVAAFELVCDQGIELHIYGRGDYSGRLKCLPANIHYHGFIEPSNVRAELKKYDFLINARSAKEGFAKYSFPSKVAESMNSGVPLITTMLPGMPDNYAEFLLVLRDNEPATIATAVKEFSKLTPSERVLRGKRAADFILSKNIISTADKIQEFIGSR